MKNYTVSINIFNFSDKKKKKNAESCIYLLQQMTHLWHAAGDVSVIQQLC